MTAGESNNREVSTVVIGKTRNSFLGKTTHALILAAICLASAAHAVERVEPDRKVQIEKKAKTPSAATKAKASGFCVKWVCTACRRLKGSTDGGTFRDKKVVPCAEIKKGKKPPKCNYVSSEQCTSQYDSPAFEF